MATTTFGGMVRQFGGAPVGSGYVAEVGPAIFVRPSTGNDGNSGSAPNLAFKTLAKALSTASANTDTVVYLIAESNTAASTTDYQAAVLDWNKDGVHLIGVGASPMIGSRARIAQLSTVKTIDTLFKLSANNCLVANLEVFQGVATSTATLPVAFEVTGDRNRVVNCQLSGNGDTGGSMDVAGARSLKLTGAENMFQHCYIGLDTVLRATQTAEVFVNTGARNIFEDCVINSYTSLSTFKAVSMTAPDRFVNFVRCMLIAVQNITSAVAPTGAIDPGSINGQVNMIDSGVFGYAGVTTADSSLVFLLGNQTSSRVAMSVAKTTDVA